MSFESEWQNLCHMAISQNCFDYSRTDKDISFAKLLREKSVSKGYGVYAIYGHNDNDSENRKPIYIGMAGTIKKNGSIGNQGLRKRLNRIAFKNEKIAVARRLVFMYLLDLPIEDPMKAQLISKRYPDFPKFKKLHFKWIELYPKEGNPMPQQAEKWLLEAFCHEHNELPLINKRM